LRTSSDATGALAIQAEGLGKRYRIHSGGRRQETLRDLLTNSARALLMGKLGGGSRQSFWALKDVSFQIRPGENVGILGLNGAGKSTLLKVLSRVTDPTEGRARMNGRLGSLLEVGTGFHGELTGRENIFLYGAILGMTHAEIARKFDAIVAFSGIEEFIDTPVKRYSSGMFVRLAFSVAAQMEPDILLLDEVLAVGDLAFQRKCMDFAKDLQKRDATILFVSHNLFSIKSMCERVIYLRHGRVVFDGPTEQGIERYEADCRLSDISWAKPDAGAWPVRITDVAVTDQAGAPKTVFDYGEPMRVRVAFEAHGPVKDPNFILAIVRSDGVACCNYSTEVDGFAVDPAEGVIELLTPPLSLVSELYTLEILVRRPGLKELIGAQIGGTFHVRHPVFNTHFGVFHEPGEWSCGEDRLPAAQRATAVEAVV
jgi:lipopolysaccharide transport system ATP-binding protein